MGNDLYNYLAIMNRLTAVYDGLPNLAATEAVNFTKERFRAQNWVDTTTIPWKKRKRPKKRSRSDNRAILVKSGRLRRSPRKKVATRDYAIIAIDVPYAQIHNDGGKVKGTVNVKTHDRKSHRRRRNDRTETVAAHTVNAHSRRVNFKVPQRRFIGQSAVLNTRIQRVLTAEIIKAIRG